jgi:hypothetical protein
MLTVWPAAVCVAAASKKDKFVKDNPGQMVITAGQIVWTAECEKALSDADGAKKALKLLKKKWVGYLNKLTAVTCSKLNTIDRNKVAAAKWQTPMPASAAFSSLSRWSPSCA